MSDYLFDGFDVLGSGADGRRAPAAKHIQAALNLQTCSLIVCFNPISNTLLDVLGLQQL